MQEYICQLNPKRKSLSSRRSQLAKLVTACPTKGILWEEEKKSLLDFEKGMYFLSFLYRAEPSSSDHTGLRLLLC